MSWDPYVSDYMLNFTDINSGQQITNANQNALIMGFDGAVWAASSGFSLHNGLVELEQNDGSMKKVQVNEFENLSVAYTTAGATIPSCGIRINGKKYIVVSYNATVGAIYLKTNGGGACFAKTETAYLLACWDKSQSCVDSAGKKTEQNPGLCNRAVEQLQKFLIDSGC